MEGRFRDKRSGEDMKGAAADRRAWCELVEGLMRD